MNFELENFLWLLTLNNIQNVVYYVSCLDSATPHCYQYLGKEIGYIRCSILYCSLSDFFHKKVLAWPVMSLLE